MKKLTPFDVHSIRRLIAFETPVRKLKNTTKQIAKCYHVSPQCIYDIKNKKTWAWFTGFRYYKNQSKKMKRFLDKLNKKRKR